MSRLDIVEAMYNSNTNEIEFIKYDLFGNGSLYEGVVWGDYVNGNTVDGISIDVVSIFADLPTVAIVQLNRTVTPFPFDVWLDNGSSTLPFLLSGDVYFESYEAMSSLSGVSGSSVDLTSVLSQLSDISTRLQSMPTTIDLTPVIDLLSPLQVSELNNLHEDVVSLSTQLSTVTVSLQSLDGNFDTYPNGTVVQIYPSSRDYTVESSFFFRNDTNQFVAMYWIVDSANKRVSVPHNYLVIPTVPEGA